jgi:hypothetical protein
VLINKKEKRKMFYKIKNICFNLDVNGFIQTQNTPNPNSLKFLPDQTLLEPNQTREFLDAKSARVSPLAR